MWPLLQLLRSRLARNKVRLFGVLLFGPLRMLVGLLLFGPLRTCDLRSEIRRSAAQRFGLPRYYVLAGANDPGKLEVGQVPPGQVIMTHEKEWTCGTTQLIGWDDSGNGIRCPCCCCLPYLETKDANGTVRVSVPRA